MKTHPSADPNPELHVDELGENQWAWRYVEGDMELNSNETFATREEAADKARRAYPDVALTE
ncbi:MAG TPA: hypothetical protein VF045_01385 [Acidimicrobiales bacterium]